MQQVTSVEHYKQQITSVDHYATGDQCRTL